MSLSAVEWYLERQQNGDTYRVAQFLATSDGRTVALQFLESFPKPGWVPVLFTVDVAEQPCHVGLLETLTCVPGESEWLFPPVSTFRVMATAEYDPSRPSTAADPLHIHVQACKDNMTESTLLPTTSWS